MAKASASPFAKEAAKHRTEEIAKVALESPEPDTPKQTKPAKIMDEPPDMAPGIDRTGPGRYRVRHPENERLTWEGEADSPEDADFKWAAAHGIVVAVDEKTKRRQILVEKNRIIEALEEEPAEVATE